LGGQDDVLEAWSLARIRAPRRGPSGSIKARSKPVPPYCGSGTKLIPWIDAALAQAIGRGGLECISDTDGSRIAGRLRIGGTRRVEWWWEQGSGVGKREKGGCGSPKRAGCFACSHPPTRPKRATPAIQSPPSHPPPFSGVSSLLKTSQQIIPSHTPEAKRRVNGEQPPWSRGERYQESCFITLIAKGRPFQISVAAAASP
jgi:hypothetical protein